MIIDLREPVVRIELLYSGDKKWKKRYNFVKSRR